MSQDRRSVWGWALYDWANSAFATTVVAGFFPIFFKQYWSAGADVNTSTAQLGFGNALASLLVALLAPLLGAIADQASVKKRMLGTFAYLGVLGTAALFLVESLAFC
jgi:UMF1 family MFS transporter